MATGAFGDVAAFVAVRIERRPPVAVRILAAHPAGRRIEDVLVAGGATHEVVVIVRFARAPWPSGRRNSRRRRIRELNTVYGELEYNSKVYNASNILAPQPLSIIYNNGFCEILG